MKKTVGFIIIAALAFTACSEKKAVIPDVEPELPRPHDPVVVQPQENITPLIEMVFIKGGSFQMGSREQINERPVHRVALDNFYLGKYEVTQEQYLEITGIQPENSSSSNPEDSSPDGWKNLPVAWVSWYDVLVFCNKLSVKEKFNPVYRIYGSTDPDNWEKIPLPQWDAVEMIEGSNGYRLPTEAEWEYAARGGEGARHFSYAGSNNADSVSWYYDNSDYKLHEIGKKSPNNLGLYDMSGNIMEWCWDWEGAYNSHSQDNPIGPVSGEDRIIRGGSWSFSVVYGRVTYRHHNNPAFKAINLGFRVARSD